MFSIIYLCCHVSHTVSLGYLWCTPRFCDIPAETKLKCMETVAASNLMLAYCPSLITTGNLDYMLF